MHRTLILLYAFSGRPLIWKYRFKALKVVTFIAMVYFRNPPSCRNVIEI